MKILLLKIKDLYKIYGKGKDAVHALKGINLDIIEGEVISLLGPNGAGKTTLSSVLATVHPATSGQVLFKDKSIYSDIDSYREQLGFCPQKANLDPFLNVEENLIFSGRYFLIPEQEIQKRTNDLLKKLEIEHYRKFNIKALSGGNRQRVLIARALIHQPKIVILDEPTVGLDPDIRRQIWEIVKQLKQDGITVIITTHYLDEAEELSDRVCILNKGKIILAETVSALKERHSKQNLEQIFMKIMEEERAEDVNSTP